MTLGKPLDAQLLQSEAVKLSISGVQHCARLLPGGEMFVPVVLQSSGYASSMA